MALEANTDSYVFKKNKIQLSSRARMPNATACEGLCSV